MKKLLLALLIVFTANSAAFAFLKEGQQLPHDLKVPDQDGEMQSFESLAGEKGLILIFVRSADWCPYCQRQLIEMNQAYEPLTALGYGVASVSYDGEKTLSIFAKRHSINYTLLSDEKSEIIKSFGILNTEMQEGTNFYGIPHPAVYVINSEKQVVARFAEEGYKDRPPSSLIIEKLETLGN